MMTRDEIKAAMAQPADSYQGWNFIPLTHVRLGEPEIVIAEPDDDGIIVATCEGEIVATAYPEQHALTRSYRIELPDDAVIGRFYSPIRTRFFLRWAGAYYLRR